MNTFWARFHEILHRPVAGWSRAVLAVSVVLLVLAFTGPLWHIHMQAPQYPKGLDLYVYAYTIEGGREGRDLREINTLNHYIGMQALERADFADLDWIPFALGALILLALRVAAIGDVRSLVDLAVIAIYFGIFSAGRFVFKLYGYGHNLDPHAPFTVEPFMPPVIGTQQLANFTVTSLPGPATFWVGGFVTIVMALAFAHLVLPRRMGVPAL